ncbi:hypothetical protein TIFTF001_018807 [Ficus carica]|uniref:Uncharacterized protein n=1 Tax=Ficus carica TaxID=3494 RepID=A0AA88A7R0_FICCA|nr:hypothetical protein TIFTF001_018807 [Ficus carica]
MLPFGKILIQPQYPHVSKRADFMAEITTKQIATPVKVLQILKTENLLRNRAFEFVSHHFKMNQLGQMSRAFHLG